MRETERGYILLMAALFMAILAAGASTLLRQVDRDAAVSGAVRDQRLALAIAEAALNKLWGDFANQLDSDGDGTLDRDETAALFQNQANPAPFLMPYMFVVSAGGGIDQTEPGLLQRVADGEARASSAGGPISGIIAAGVTESSLDSLFETGRGPVLYTVGGDGILRASASPTWTGEPATLKGAAWIEVIKSTTNPGGIDLVAESAGQAGAAKAYVQRTIASYVFNSSIGILPLIGEASNINRALP